MEHQKKKKKKTKTNNEKTGVMSLSFIPGLTEDHSPGESLSVVPKGGEGRDWEEVSLHIISGWEIYVVNIYLSKRLLLFSKTSCLQLMILMLFSVWENARVWVYWNCSWGIPQSKGSTFPKHRVTHPVIVEFPLRAVLVSDCSGLGLNPCRTGWWAMLCILLCLVLF